MHADVGRWEHPYRHQHCGSGDSMCGAMRMGADYEYTREGRNNTNCAHSSLTVRTDCVKRFKATRVNVQYGLH